MPRNSLLPGLGALALSGLVFISPAIAQNSAATTTPVGFVSIQLTGNADSIVSVPLNRPAEFVGRISGASGNVVQLQGTPGFTANQFVYQASTQPKTFYILIGNKPGGTNPKEGEMYPVTANGTDSLTVDLGGDVINSIEADTPVTVYPFPTLGSVFPASDEGVSFAASTSGLVHKTEILTPDINGAGINRPASAAYYFYNAAWRKIGQPITESFDDTTLLPTAYFIVRNKNTETKVLTILGSVDMSVVTLPIATQTSGSQDNLVSVIRPTPVKLDDLGLIASGAFQISTSPLVRKDQLYTFDNSLVGLNKPTAAAYFYYNGAWRKVGQAITDNYGTDTIPPGSGIILRTVQTNSGMSLAWKNSPAY